MKKLLFLQLFLLSIIGAYSQNVQVYENKGLYGLKNLNDKVVIKASYDNLYLFNDNMYIAEKNRRKGVVSDKGRVILEPVYYAVERFGYDNFMVSLNGKWGVLDRSGKEIIPIEYSSFEQLSDYLYVVTKDGKKGLANKLGYLVAESTYQDVKALTDYMFSLKDGNTVLIVDNLGKPLFSGNYDSFEKLGSYSFYEVTKNGKKGLVDIDGTMITDIVYDYIDTTNDYFILLNQGGKCGFVINRKCIPAVYDRIVFIQPDLGVIAVKQDKLNGFITFNGDIVSPVYENLSRFGASGYAFVERKGKLLYVNTKGTEKELHEVLGNVTY